jgi:hypothetical protein
LEINQQTIAAKVLARKAALTGGLLLKRRCILSKFLDSVSSAARAIHACHAFVPRRPPSDETANSTSHGVDHAG